MRTRSELYDVSWRVFGGAIACAEAVCEAVVEAMEEAIARRGQAVVALSGGGTPRVMLSRLGEEALDWTRVTMVLVDERWCDHDDEHSNFKMISAQLEPAVEAGATIRPLWRASGTAEEAAKAASMELRELLPLDLVVLGMGADAHTASWIPGAEGVEAALLDTGPEVRVVRPTDGRHLRLTLTRGVVIAARRRILHVTGSEKRAVLDAALGGDGDWARVPIRAALGGGAITIYHGAEGP